MQRSKPDTYFCIGTAPTAPAERVAVSCASTPMRNGDQSAPTRDLMIATVAHDLRNPLGAMHAVLENVLARLPQDESHQAVRRQLYIARSAADDMLALVTDLLDGTTMESARLALQLDWCDPAEVVSAALQSLTPLAERQRTSLIGDIDPALPPILADRGRLARVFSNLGTNAIRFTPSGGAVTLGAARQGNAVRFRVSDTGIGIAPHDLPRVFERFWHGAAGGGTGLGLTIAKCIVEAHRGRIWVDSSPRLGSSFSFTIPLAAAA